MPTKALADARGAQWTKLIFNAASQPARRADRPHARAPVRAAGDARADQRPGRRGRRGRRRARDHARLRPRGADRPRRARWPTTTARRCSRTRSRTGAPRSTRSTAGIVRFGARARRADAAQRGDRRADRRHGALVDLATGERHDRPGTHPERRRDRAPLRERARGDGRARRRRAARLRQRVHRLRGRRALPVGLSHRAPLRLRAARRRRRPDHDLPERGALGRRSRRRLDRASRSSPSTRAPGSATTCASSGVGASASTGSTT